MKQILTLIAFSVIITSCNSSNESKPPEKIIKDTTKNVLAVYKSAINGAVNPGFVDRVIEDTAIYVYADTVSNNQKNWVKDTFYIINYVVPVDTAISLRYKVPLLDSTGKKNNITLIVKTEKKFVRSGWNGVDSILVKQLRDQQ